MTLGEDGFLLADDVDAASDRLTVGRRTIDQCADAYAAYEREIQEAWRRGK
jgi:hypothetical protein